MRLKDMTRKQLNTYIKKLNIAILHEDNLNNIIIYQKWLDEANEESNARLQRKQKYLDFINKKTPY